MRLPPPPPPADRSLPPLPPDHLVHTNPDLTASRQSFRMAMGNPCKSGTAHYSDNCAVSPSIVTWFSLFPLFVCVKIFFVDALAMIEQPFVGVSYLL